MQAVLDRILSAQATFAQGDHDRPFILLTWAQSADAMLAAAPGVQTAISGAKSLAMTHALRALHDAILVGVGTILIDDPRLSCRLEPEVKANIVSRLAHHGSGHSANSFHPRPVVLDTNLRTPPEATFLTQYNGLPIVFTGASNGRKGMKTTASFDGRCVIEPTINAQLGDDKVERITLQHVMNTLRKKYEISSVMVEGGPSVLTSFLRESLCDLVIITVAPQLLGAGTHLSGRSTANLSFKMMKFVNPQWLQFGNDVVLIGEPACDR